MLWDWIFWLSVPRKNGFTESAFSGDFNQLSISGLEGGGGGGGGWRG